MNYNSRPSMEQKKIKFTWKNGKTLRGSRCGSPGAVCELFSLSHFFRVLLHLSRPNELRHVPEAANISCRIKQH